MRRLDLLDAADHPAVHEVADHPGLRRRERRRAAVRLRGRAAGRAAAAAPAVAVVAVQVGADVRRAAVGLAVLAPRPVAAGGDVVLGAVRVDRRDDPDLPAVHDVADPGVGGVVVGVLVQQVQRHLHGQVLPGVVVGLVEHLGLVLVGAHVVGDLHRDDVPALVRLCRASACWRSPGTPRPPGSPRRSSRRSCGTPRPGTGSRGWTAPLSGSSAGTGSTLKPSARRALTSAPVAVIVRTPCSMPSIAAPVPATALRFANVRASWTSYWAGVSSARAPRWRARRRCEDAAVAARPSRAAATRRGECVVS